MALKMEITELLKYIVEQEGSDLVLHSDAPPLIRRFGDLYPIEGLPKIEGDGVRDLVYPILSEEHIKRFEEDWELDIGYSIPGVSRFRVNCFVQRGTMAAVFRAIPFKIPTFDDLRLTPRQKQVFAYMAERPRGLVLVTGPTGCGKTTTLAAMINHINHKIAHHIVTIEDPIEYVHEDVKSLIDQRELYVDTHSFAEALKHVLRQDPDVILVGEMRDLETMQLAITAAETGHLVFATLHTTDAVQTVDRVIDVFPPFQQQQIRMQLSVNLVGVISQTLCKLADGSGRIAAWEIMVAVPAIRNMIREAKTHQIYGAIQTGQKQGMQTLDQSLAGLVQRGLVTYEEARQKASNLKEFEKQLQLAEAAEERAPAAATADAAAQVQAAAAGRVGPRGEGSAPGAEGEGRRA